MRTQCALGRSMLPGVDLRFMVLLLATMLVAVVHGQATTPDVAALDTMAARFAPVEIRVDLAALPDNERQAMAKMIDAARVLDAVYLRQVSPTNEARLLVLASDTSAIGRARLRYFLINKGPWSEVDADRPFLAGVEPKPPQANFYPSDATRTEVEAWLSTLTGPEHAAAVGYFTTIRRTAQGKLAAVPYSLEYQPELSKMSRLLREAAALTRQPTLKTFLDKRAAAFQSNDYYESDVAWMDLDSSIEPTIGPYEVYLDQWFNFKAAFEAFITLNDAAESQRLERFSRELQELENHLPIEPVLRRPKLGSYAPIRVVNVVYNSGDGAHSSLSAAYNLPNDDRVVDAKGSKRILLKNFQEAKYNKVLLPIAAIALAPKERSFVKFDAFFTHILMHELMHGLGPHEIHIAGRDTTVSQELKELYGPLEEAKADVSGLWALQYLIDKGVLDKHDERSMYMTFLTSTFRTLRFGLSEAHAQGMALQVNNFFDHGAIQVDADGAFSLDIGKAKRAVTDLTREIMTLQAHGDSAAVRALFKSKVSIRPEVRRVLDKLNGVPIDIAPQLVTANELSEAEH